VEKNDSFNNNNRNDNQFVISYELICLLQWILEHESDQLKMLVQRAMQSDMLQDDATKSDDGEENTTSTIEDIQEIIIDFFELCDTLMAEVSHEQSIKKAIAKNLMPAIGQIDSKVCDNNTVRSSINSTTEQLDITPNASAKETLFREILRQWKPNKKQAIN